MILAGTGEGIGPVELAGFVPDQRGDLDDGVERDVAVDVGEVLTPAGRLPTQVRQAFVPDAKQHQVRRRREVPPCRLHHLVPRAQVHEPVGHIDRSPRDPVFP